MGRSRANSYNHSPFLAALLGGLGNYFGSDVSAVTPEEGPMPGGETIDENQPHFKANNFLANPRARELEQQYQLRKLYEQLGVKSAVQQATQLSPIQSATAGATTAAQQAALNKAELDLILAKANPAITKALAVAGLAQGKTEAQNAAEKERALLPTKAEGINYATLASKGAMANPENIALFNTQTPDIAVKEKRAIDEETLKHQVGANALTRQEGIAKATYPTELGRAITDSGIAKLTSEHKLTGLPESFQRQDVLERQQEALGEGRIMDTIFKSTPGGLFNLQTQKVIPGTQAHTIDPALIQGLGVKGYSSQTSAGTQQPVRAPIDRSSIANPQDWRKNTVTGELVNINTGERVNPQTMGKGSPTPSTLTPSIVTSINPPPVAPVTTPKPSPLDAIIDSLVSGGFKNQAEQTQPQFGGYKTYTPPTSPYIDPQDQSMQNTSQAYDSNGKLKPGWELGPDGQPRRKKNANL